MKGFFPALSFNKLTSLFININSFALGANLLRVGAQFLYMTLLAKNFGVEDFSIWIFWVTILNIISPICTLGAGPYLIKSISANDISEKQESLIKSASMIFFVASTAILFFVCLVFVGWEMSLYLVFVEFFLVRFFELLSQFKLSRGGRIEYIFLYNFVSPVKLIVTFLFILLGGGYSFFYLGLGYFLFSIILIVFCLFSVFSKEDIISKEVAYRESISYSLTTFYKSLFLESDKYTIGFMSSLNVGSYGYASKFMNMIFFPTQVLLSINAPRIFSIAGGDNKNLDRFLLKCAVLSVVFSLVAVLIGMVVLPVIVSFLGDGFDDIIDYYFILIASPVFMGLHYVYFDGITALGFQRIREKVNFYASILTIIGMFVLAFFLGVKGVAFGVVIVNISLFLVAIFLYRKMRAISGD